MEFYRPNTAVLGCVHSPNYLLLQLQFLCCSYTSQLSPGGALLTLLHTPSPALACALLATVIATLAGQCVSSCPAFPVFWLGTLWMVPTLRAQHGVGGGLQNQIGLGFPL